jgi:glycosyltransferase involved in cell wall biosynthesis
MATVAANVAKYFLARRLPNTFFFVGHQVVAHEYVAIAISASPGGYLRSLLNGGAAVAGSVGAALNGCQFSYGLFTGSKPFHRFFDRELVIVYDISSLLMPELHMEQTVRNHGESLLKDALSSDLICCISEATERDVLTYLPVPKGKTFVAHLGSDWTKPPTDDRPSAHVVVLGTVEPRKNLKLVAAWLEARPEICDDFSFVFVGASGWGARFDTIFSELLAHERIGRALVFTGYLHEQQKRSLVASATCAIYPSLFEGFGLPVVECLSVGCPVLTARTSSLVELGVPPDCHFDPFSVAELDASFRKVIALSDTQRAALAEELIRISRRFSWEDFGNRIVAALFSPGQDAALARSEGNPA